MYRCALESKHKIKIFWEWTPSFQKEKNTHITVKWKYRRASSSWTWGQKPIKSKKISYFESVFKSMGGQLSMLIESNHRLITWPYIRTKSHVPLKWQESTKFEVTLQSNSVIYNLCHCSEAVNRAAPTKNLHLRVLVIMPPCSWRFEVVHFHKTSKTETKFFLKDVKHES